MEKKRTDWIADPSTEHFSGEAVYTRDVMLHQQPQGRIVLEVLGGSSVQRTTLATATPAAGPAGLPNPLVTRTGPGMRAWYDPPVREAALVSVNGKDAGALWHPPYTLDVSNLLHKGKNHIEIRVFNTALNGWSAAPKRDYRTLKEAYGDRFQMQDLDKVQPVSSGLLGAVVLSEQKRR